MLRPSWPGFWQLPCHPTRVRLPTLFGKPETLSIGVVGIAALADSITAGDSASPSVTRLIQEPRQETNSRKTPSSTCIVKPSVAGIIDAELAVGVSYSVLGVGLSSKLFVSVGPIPYNVKLVTARHAST